MVALVLALFPQGEHTAQVFLSFSHDDGNGARFFAYAFAAAVEVAVLLFVLAGHKRISYLFAGASFFTNLVYYAIGGVALLSVELLPVLLLSALLPACIVGYSHTIADSTHARPEAHDTQQAHAAPVPVAASKPAPVHAPAPQPTHVATPAAAEVVNTDAVTTAVTTQPTTATTTDELPERARLAYAMHQKQRPQREIAQELGVSLRTVQKDITRAREVVTYTNGGARHD